MRRLGRRSFVKSGAALASAGAISFAYARRTFAAGRPPLVRDPRRVLGSRCRRSEAGADHGIGAAGAAVTVAGVGPLREARPVRGERLLTFHRRFRESSRRVHGIHALRGLAGVDRGGGVARFLRRAKRLARRERGGARWPARTAAPRGRASVARRAGPRAARGAAGAARRASARTAASGHAFAVARLRTSGDEQHCDEQHARGVAFLRVPHVVQAVVSTSARTIP